MQQALDFGQVISNGRDKGMTLREFYNTMLQCLERAKQRRQLLRLDDRLLNDIVNRHLSRLKNPAG